MDVKYLHLEDCTHMDLQLRTLGADQFVVREAQKVGEVIVWDGLVSFQAREEIVQGLEPETSGLRDSNSVLMEKRN